MDVDFKTFLSDNPFETLNLKVKQEITCNDQK